MQLYIYYTLCALACLLASANVAQSLPCGKEVFCGGGAGTKWLAGYARLA